MYIFHLIKFITCIWICPTVNRVWQQKKSVFFISKLIVNMLTEQLVLVTGAGGFLASHIVLRLQLDGYRVRGTVRSLTDTAKLAAIRNLAPQAKHKIELVEANLLHAEGWDQAVSGCWAVLHVANPFPGIFHEIPDDEFQEACQEGTKRILKAAAKAGVKKFVYTSSLAAVIGAPTAYPEGWITEDTRTDINLPGLIPIEKSRALAEASVWDFVEKMPEKERFDLTVLIPTGMIGPPLLKPAILTGTIEQMQMVFTRVIPGCPNLQMAVCDVRDAAYAQCKALTTPKASGQRVIIHSESTWTPEYVKILAKEFKPQGYSFYTNTLPTFVMWLPTFFDKRLAKSGIIEKIGVPIKVDNSKMKEVFDIKPRPMSDSILDMAYAMIDLDIIVRGKKYRQAGSRLIATPSTS